MSFGLKDISFIVAILTEIILPVVLAIIVAKKYRLSWAIFFLGILMFIASLIRIPLNNYMGGLISQNISPDYITLLAAVFSSLTAGIFEEGARVLGIGLIIKNRNIYKGLMYGIGHGGGGESMIFIGFTLMANYVIFRFFPEILPQSGLSQFAQMQWYLPLVGALERIFAIAIQISLSVLIMYSFIYKKFYLIAVAVLYHALVDFIAVYINYLYGMIFAELSIFIFAAFSITFTVFMVKKYQKDNKQFA